jgi:hypothetical protein
MNMFSTNVYNFEVLPETRNHKGAFVQETSYRLMDITRAGWAYVCHDNVTCHYIDPDNLRETSHDSDR